MTMTNDHFVSKIQYWFILADFSARTVTVNGARDHSLVIGQLVDDLIK